MTVETQTNEVTANGNSVATVFSFSPVVIFDPDDLTVVVTVTATGVQTTLARGTSSTTYSVSVTTYPGTGSITYPASGGTPLATGSTITMTRDLTIEQTTDLGNQGGYHPEVLEQALDRLTMYQLQASDQGDRAIRLPAGEVATSANTVLLASAARASKYMAWDASGNITAIAGAVSTVGVSAFMLTLLDDTSQAQAAITLGVTSPSAFMATVLDDVDAATARATLGVVASTTAASGIVELATNAETQTGTDTARAVTPDDLTSKEATVANYRANTADRILTTDIVWSAQAEVTLTDGANIAVDFSTFFNGTVTLAGNRALTNPTNTKVGQRGRIRIVQDGTGSRTLSYGTSYEWAGTTAGILSTAAAAEDMLYYDIISSTRILLSLVKAIA